MKYGISDFLKHDFKPGELENPYKAELLKIGRKKNPCMEDYARYLFLLRAVGFWEVNQEQEDTGKADYIPLYELYIRIPEENRDREIYYPWPELLEWCRCFVLQRMGYETAALNYISTLKAYIREDAVLRLWAGDLQNIMETLKAGGVDVEKWKNLWELPKGLPVGYELEDLVGKDHKIKAVLYAKKSIIAMIKFLRLADTFLEMLGKNLKFDPSAFTSSPSRWNRIILELGGIFQDVEMYLLQKEPAKNTPQSEVKRLEATKDFWRGIVEEILDALKHEWTAKELKPLKDKMKTKEDCFHFYDAPTDVEFILEVFGADGEY